MRVEEVLQSGASLGVALEREGMSCPPLFRSMVVIGEETGRLAEIFRRLESYYAEKRALRGILIRQLSYPCALYLGIAIGIPVLRVVLTSTVEGTDGLAMEVAMTALPGLITVAFVWLIFLAVSHIPPIRRAVQVVATHLWPLSRLWRRWAMSRVAWALELTTAGGFPPIRAVQFAAYAAGDPHVKRGLLAAVPLLQQGAPMAQALAVTGQFSPQDLAFISVGEEGGKLDEVFGHIGRMYYLDAVYLARNVLSVTGLLVFLAIVFGSVILA